MAMRSSAAVPRGLRRLFSSFAFTPPPNTAAAHTTPPLAEPSKSFFVSGKGMTMRTSAAAHCGMRRLFSSLDLNPPPSTAADTAPPPPPPVEPSKRLFVSGLSNFTTSEGLRDAFSKFGKVLDARVVNHRKLGYSLGYGYVRYATIEDAAEGVKGMDGKFLDRWVIFAEYAPKAPKAPKAPRSSSPSQNAGVPPVESPFQS